MKEASGELNMTVITIIAIAAVSAFFIGVIWPRIQTTINTQWDTINSGSSATIR